MELPLGDELNFISQAKTAVDELNRSVDGAVKGLAKAQNAQSLGIKSNLANATTEGIEREPTQAEMRNFSKLFLRKMDQEGRNFQARFAGKGLKGDLKDFREGIGAFVSASEGRMDMGTVKDFGEFFESSADYLKKAGLKKIGNFAENAGSAIMQGFGAVAPYAGLTFAVQNYLKPMVAEAVFARTLEVAESTAKARDSFKEVFAADFERNKTAPWAQTDKEKFIKEFEDVLRKRLFEGNTGKDVYKDIENVNRKIEALKPGLIEARTGNAAMLSRALGNQNNPMWGKDLPTDRAGLEKLILGVVLNAQGTAAQKDYTQFQAGQQLQNAMKELAMIQDRERAAAEKQSYLATQTNAEGIRNSVLWKQRTLRLRAVEEATQSKAAGWNSY